MLAPGLDILLRTLLPIEIHLAVCVYAFVKERRKLAQSKERIFCLLSVTPTTGTPSAGRCYQTNAGIHQEKNRSGNPPHLLQGKDAGELLIQWTPGLDVAREHYCLGGGDGGRFHQRTELTMKVQQIGPQDWSLCPKDLVTSGQDLSRQLCNIATRRWLPMYAVGTMLVWTLAKSDNLSST